jgi:DNA-binding transcriptional LysR family regulator
VAKVSYEVLDLKALRCFFAMAKHGSLTKAGIELGISEAAVSQRVKGLERELGVKLYEARGGRVRLTAAGERAMSLAASMFDEIEAFEHALTKSEETGEVVLSSHDTVLGYLLPEMVEKFSRLHPLARLRLLARPVEETVQLVKANEVDLGVIPARELPKGLAFYPIATYPAYLLTSKGHPLARQARADFKTLVNEETIMRHPLIVAEVQLEGRVLKDTFARVRLPLNIGLEVGTVDTVKRCVARGLGVAVVSGLCVTEADRIQLDVVEVPREYGADSVYGVVMRHDKHRAALLRDLLGILGVPSRSLQEAR